MLFYDIKNIYISKKQILIKTLHYILLMFLCFVMPGFSQKPSVAVLEKYLHELQTATNEDDLNRLSQQFALSQSKEIQEALAVIQKAMLGSLYARKADCLNDKSSALYEEATLLADALSYVPLQVWVHTQTGFYYYSYNEYLKAAPYFLKSSRLLTPIPDKDLLDGVEVLKKNAYFFQTTQDHDKSIRHLNRALKLASSSAKNYATLLNTIGILYLEKDSLLQATHFFEQTKRYALQSHDTLRYAKALGDLARVHIKKENWDEAEVLLLEDIALSIKKGNDRNTMFARLQLGILYWKKGDVAKALTTLTQVQQYASSKSYLKGYEKESVEVLLEIAMYQKDTAKELILRRKLDTLRVITHTENDKALKQIALFAQKNNVEWELESKQEKLKKMQFARWMWTIASILLMLVIILSFVLYRRHSKLKYIEFKRKLLAFQYQKIQSEKTLIETNTSLKSYKTYLVEKNRQIRELNQVIRTMKKTASNTTAHRANALEQLLSSHLMTDESWALFKQTFITEQPDYYERLLDHFPDLTESNLRIILLQKVGLNNTDTAEILGITIDAVKKAKQRLRKKYTNDFDLIVNG